MNLLRHAFPAGPPFDKIVAAFTTRRLARGGTPSGNLDTGLNTGEDPVRILENRRLIFDTLGLEPGSLTAGKQVHGDNVEKVTERLKGKGALNYKEAIPSTDGLVTDVPGIPIGVFTADCVPLFLYDPERMAVGVVHAGWRSSALGIASKAVNKMREEFGSDPADMWAAIGPSIGPCCYEVGEDVLVEFEKRFDYASSLFTNTDRGKWHLDLWLANSRQLQNGGISEERILKKGICSACNADQYFSARKLGPRTGRTLSVIAVKPTGT